MEDRHRDQRDVGGGPFVPVRPLGIPADEVEQIGMRQHRALRLARGAGGVELDRDVLRPHLDIAIIGAMRIAPGSKILPFRHAPFGRDHMAHARQLAADIADQRDEFGPDEQHRRLAILDDESNLRSGQPPVHRGHHRTGLDRPKQQLKIDVAVLAEIGDSLARLDTERLQGIGDTIGVAVERRKAGRAALEFVERGVAEGSASRAHDFGQGCLLCKVGHLAPAKSFQVARSVRPSGNKDNTDGALGVSADAVACERSRSARQPRDALSFSFCALMESRALAQSSSLQSRN